MDRSPTSRTTGFGQDTTAEGATQQPGPLPNLTGSRTTTRFGGYDPLALAARSPSPRYTFPRGTISPPPPPYRMSPPPLGSPYGAPADPLVDALRRSPLRYPLYPPAADVPPYVQYVRSVERMQEEIGKLQDWKTRWEDQVREKLALQRKVDELQTRLNGGSKDLQAVADMSNLSSTASTRENDPNTLMNKLQAADTKSLLKKHMTQDVFNVYKDTKTLHGGTLADVMRSGVLNTDSGVGVYAPDDSAYDRFKLLFDGVIESYHGFKPDQRQPPPDFSLCDWPNIDPKGEYIISTRVRTARNLSGFPLPPLLTKEHRSEIEGTVKTSLEKFTGDLAGKYYPLDGMDESTRQSLVDDHFLFKKGDRFLEAAGINDDWPVGRGIFHNNDKTFLVWVGEEDELRIISMEKGFNLRSVFDRLGRAVGEMEKNFKFIHHPRLGYISACPTNLGTGLRASVHMKIPNVSALPNFKEICESMNIQPRGIHGEHSESAGGVYDLSNKHRVGYTEAQLVKSMYDGVVALYYLEKALEGAVKSRGGN